MDTMIHVGADKDSITIVGEIIVDILKCGQDQVTIQKALDALVGATKVEGTTISECSFNTGS